MCVWGDGGGGVPAKVQGFWYTCMWGGSVDLFV